MATETNAAGPRDVAPCSLRLDTQKYSELGSGLCTSEEYSHAKGVQSSAHLLFDPLYQLLVRLRDAVRDAVGHALLPYMVVVHQRPVAETQRSTGAVTVYHHLCLCMTEFILDLD